MNGSTGVKAGVAALILALLPTVLCAAVVRISWNANTEADLEGYRVFSGTSPGRYSRVINVGRRTAVDVGGLANGATYYFAVTAYDFSGNESAYSTEASVSIPGGESSGGSSGLADGVDALVEWLEQVVRNLFGLDPDVPVYALGDFGEVDDTCPVQPSGAVMGGSLSNRDPASRAALCDVYPVRDAILEAAVCFDLSALYPEGSYLFYPLDSDCPDIDGTDLTADGPGLFLYAVFGETGGIDHLLRLSVAEEIFLLGSYDPVRGHVFEDPTTGIAVDLPGGATKGFTPVAVGWGGFDAFPGSAVLAPEADACVFDILPYGLELALPAVISLPWAGETATVEWYDMETDRWVRLEDVRVEGGELSFTSQALGRFQVSTPRANVSESEPYEGRAGACFIRSAGL